MQERKIVQEFLRHLGEDDGLATYGEEEVIRQLKNVNVYTLLVSNAIKRWQVTLKCRSCGYTETKIIDIDQWEEFEEQVSKMNCLSCEGGSYEIEEREDLIEVFVKLSKEAGARLEIISTHIEEGEMLFRSFGGIAAITKYRTS